MLYMVSVVSDDPSWPSRFTYVDERRQALLHFERAVHFPGTVVAWVYHYTEGASPHAFLHYDRDA